MKRTLAFFCLGFLPILAGCWLLQHGVDPNTGLPTPSPADTMSSVLPFPWNLVAAALLPTVTTAVAAWEARKRGKAIKQIAKYADTIEVSETGDEVRAAKDDLEHVQKISGTKKLVQKLRGKTV